MNVLHVNSESSWRGGEQQLAYLIEGLKGSPSVKNYVMGRQGSELEDWCLKHEVDFVNAPLKGGADVISSLKVKSFCSDHNIDIVHAHTSHAHSAVLYAKLLGLSSKMAIHRRVSFALKKGFFKRMKYAARCIDGIICISEDVKRVLQEVMGDDERLVLIYDSIDQARFKKVDYEKSFTERYELPDSEFIVVNTSALSPEKDYKTFVDAADLILKSGLNVCFLIVGEGRDQEEIARYVVEKGLDNHVKLIGFVDDVGDVFKHASLLLMTSIKEGLGTSILEAFLHRVPVVATRTGGIPEIVKHGVTGMLADTACAQESARHVIEVLRDSELQSTLADSAFQLVDREFRSTRMVDETVAFYREILRK